MINMINYKTPKYGYKFVDPCQMDQVYTYNQTTLRWEIISKNVIESFLSDALPVYTIGALYVIADGLHYPNNQPEWQNYTGWIAIPTQNGKEIAEFIQPTEYNSFYCKKDMTFYAYQMGFWFPLKMA